MSHFQLEDELQSALRLDTSLLACRRSPTRRGPRDNGAGNGSLSTSRLLSAVGGAGSHHHHNGSLVLNNSARSRSATRLSPSRLLLAQPIPSASTTTSPNSKGDKGNNRSRSRTPSSGRGDRFIPNRTTTDMEASHHSLLSAPAAGASGNGADENLSAGNSAAAAGGQQWRRDMSDLLTGDGGEAAGGPSEGVPEGGRDRILSFRTKAPTADEAHVNSHKVLYSTGKPKAPSAAKTRQVPTKAEKVLDAPDLMDDFYLKPMDWSSNNHLAVALHNVLYVWNVADGSIVALTANLQEEEYISSVSWIREGNVVAMGDSKGNVDLWDVKHSKFMRSMSGHSDRVATLDWNEYIIASGSRSGAVHLHDVRVAQHHVGTLAGHTQEVCGMAWSPGTADRTLATGGNDNLVQLWDTRNQSAPVRTFNDHQAAVKAVSWCPWQPRTLATGGGTNDRQVRFWNTATGNCLNFVDTGSQVSGIVWSEEYKEVVTSHGYSHNQLTVWKYPAMTKVADLKGHTARVLVLLRSPDGVMVASAAGDETIRLWNVWPHKDKRAGETGRKPKDPVTLFGQQRIR